MGISNGNFLSACYGRNEGRIPVWIMRQAGRYLPEYRAVREKVPFVQLCRTPALIAEVVRQPIVRFGLDAAILFSDILTMLEPMGVQVEFPEGGPRIDRPIAKPEDVRRLTDFDPREKLSFVLDGIREIKRILPDVPLIGFVGSPFTLACYLIEGRGSKDFNKAKKFLYQYPAAADELFALLSEVITKYLQVQIDAGADAVKVFDSWGGMLSFDDYRRWSAEPIQRIFQPLGSANVPRILFVNNVGPYLDLIGGIDCEVVGVDYRIDLSRVAAALPDKALQGNLDPVALFGSTADVIRSTKRILDSIDDHHRLIFNLGHGILPETPVESVEAVVETVHNYRT